MEMVSFQSLGITADAVSPAMTATMEGKVSKSLKSFRKKIQKTESRHSPWTRHLAVSLKDMDIADMKIVHDSKTQELFRGIRCFMIEIMPSGSSFPKKTCALCNWFESLHESLAKLTPPIGRYHGHSGC
jgi:hypothetical protein